MCSIDSSLVAVTRYSNEVHFIRVTNVQLVKNRILKIIITAWIFITMVTCTLRKTGEQDV
ncbi:hypothetical protein DPMN_066721 [Dreissena polymorpha]|uniref:Uncharacterized protein n=1 Tax=Dreissena polymorpha TaxID=45954 RepID=A0A9D3YYF7_DREPO|nr:hypothetical protein DPMN_066721 [Dreissena polymorpha]